MVIRTSLFRRPLDACHALDIWGVVGPSPKVGFLRRIHQLNVGQGPRFGDIFQGRLGDVSDCKILSPDLQDSLHVRASSQPPLGFLGDLERTIPMNHFLVR